MELGKLNYDAKCLIKRPLNKEKKGAFKGNAQVETP